MAIEINAGNFESEVLQSSSPVLVDFWAEWCGPCKMLTPTIEALSKEFSGKAKVGKLNVDDNQHIAAKYNIMNIPTVLIFKGGNVVEQFVGAHPKGTYADAINKHI